MSKKLDRIIKGGVYLIKFSTKSPTPIMMMMQIQCLKGYHTGCEPAGDHHDEMGGVISIRGFFSFGSFLFYMHY